MKPDVNGNLRVSLHFQIIAIRGKGKNKSVTIQADGGETYEVYEDGWVHFHLPVEIKA